MSTSDERDQKQSHKASIHWSLEMGLHLVALLEQSRCLLEPRLKGPQYDKSGMRIAAI
jgi:hypothetical protein